VVKAGRGNDVVFLWEGDDLARGQGGNDEILAGDGADQVWGNGGRDTLMGEGGSDMLNGGGGHDRLDGGADDDVLTGGNGRDTFVFHLGGALDRITDFDGPRDTIELDLALGVANFGDVAGVAVQQGADLLLDFGGGDGLLLEGTVLGDLSASDFVFV
jgi:Ca2+-binding RTX toxin-like protein